MTTNIKFPAAIELTHQFVEQLTAGQLTPAQITAFVQDMVATTEGARGFFVGYLTNAATIVDQPTPAITAGLNAHPEIVADLLVKNLAMSTAQHLHWQRSAQPDMAANSSQVTQRSRQLMELLTMPQLQTISQQLSDSIQTNSGHYVEFLERWGYDAEQKEAIQQQLTSFLQQT
jgi:hypothetical protein